MFHQLFFIYRFKRIFHYKPSILGYPHLLNSPYIYLLYFPALWSCLAAEFYGLFISISLMRHKHHSLTTAIALSNAFSAFLPTLSCMHDLLAVFKPDSITITNMRVCPRLGCAPSLVWLEKCWWFSGIGVISISLFDKSMFKWLEVESPGKMFLQLMFRHEDAWQSEGHPPTRSKMPKAQNNS